MNPSIRDITLSTGVHLQYAEQSRNEGMPVLLLHGITDSWCSFEPLLAALPDRIFALSQRGHGESERPRSGYRTQDFAADAAAFIRAMGTGPMLVVGHSMGSANAMRLAMDHPKLLRGLVLVGAFACISTKAAVLDFHRSAIEPLQDPIARDFAREFQLSTLAQPVPDTFLDRVVAESLKVPARVWRAAFAALLEDDFTADIGRIAVPTRVWWGDQDGFASRADQDQLLHTIAGARGIVYAGHGHAPHWEQPQRVSADLLAFADELTGRRDVVPAA